MSRTETESDNDYAIMREGIETAVLLLSPIVPHITDALWHALGHEQALIDAAWPKADPLALEQDTIEMVVQVNGKLRGKISVDKNDEQELIEATAQREENVARNIEGKTIRKIIVVPGRLVNIVVS